MARLTFFTNPQSRGRIARWMLEEVGEPYDTEIIGYDRMKDAAYLAVNPMGKVPAIRHGDHVVTEAAAICAYLADVFPDAGLGPRDDEKADYYRWLFYAAGPVEQAVTNKAVGWEPSEDRRRMFGYGSYETVIDVLDHLLGGRDFVCGDRFTAADVYLGSAILWGTQFGTIPTRDSFEAYKQRLTAREAFTRGWAKDDEAAAAINQQTETQ
ncbi:glutathione S-transferase family protein [Sphingomonas sabuli]|uniref:Glutathione S-transferase family protein n=1 Tax=Sphingomonas sabuli TaxID=2764186 RepID=A0A7G9L2H6_9SPHN|nr:glutathione S-transferase family protein [Sphingomonas sabuli]QNM82825.1 glutathione S-transferase family protein [Sphingomonas sabuli]